MNNEKKENIEKETAPRSHGGTDGYTAEECINTLVAIANEVDDQHYVIEMLEYCIKATGSFQKKINGALLFAREMERISSYGGAKKFYSLQGLLGFNDV